MHQHKATWLTLMVDRQAVTMIEYAILGSLIAAVLVLGFPRVTAATSAAFGRMALIRQHAS